MNTFEHLIERYQAYSELSFRLSDDGLIFIDILNEWAETTLSLYGGQLLRYRPHGEPPVIWLSEATRCGEGQAFRGGIPVCWPWFGIHPDDPDKGNHGFVRFMHWQLESVVTEVDATCLLLSVSGCDRHPLWPFAFRLEQRIRIGERLEIELTVINTDEGAFSYTQAMHSYYQVGDIREVSVSGLEGAAYFDKLDDYRGKTQTGRLRLNGPADRVFCGHDKGATILDPVYRREVVINKTGSRSTVVWNPWQEWSRTFGDFTPEGYLGMLCIETANALEDSVTLEPGESHTLSLSVKSRPFG